MASRHQGKHKPRHHTQANRGSRVVTLPPLPTAEAATEVNAEPPTPASEQDLSAEAPAIA